MIKILSQEDATNIQTEQILPDIYTLVNELVKNSIDSGCTYVDVRIETAGSFITYTVEDNGAGIDVNEYFLMRGGTSKYARRGEFYGYRGMAMNALVTASDFTLLTKNASKSVRVDAKEGVISQEPMHKESAGTTVKVYNYYKRNPVRYNYLLNTLSKNINSIVEKLKKYSIFHNIVFRLYKNSTLLYKTQHRGEDVKRKITATFSMQEYVTAIFSSKNMVLECFVCTRSGSLKEMKCTGIINNRAVLMENARMDKLVCSGLQDRAAFYNLTLSREYKEIAVLKDLEAVSEYIEKSGISADVTVDIDSARKENDSARFSRRTETPIAKKVRVASEALPGMRMRGITAVVVNDREELVEHEYSNSMELSVGDLKNLKVVGQFNNGFIICTIAKPAGIHIYAVDQHAADEAVNYERLKTSYTYTRQKLIQPIKVSISTYEIYVLKENIELAEQHGFALDNGCTEILEAPVYENTVFGERELVELIEGIKDERVKAGERILFSELRKILASKACRSSIMIGRPLNMQEMKRVLSSLSKTTRPWNCPHGRPTIILLQALAK
ncbi:DNA mismatch repair protein PMS2 [Nematocida major]|uniref:DNA mismatch repair protein PMS2 n=1 Tax=Nematocida major TaxID=1912982 RepID=UPI002008873B|nr:DNA mismatch repair protein PMS2 [Nematocida major]KAH9385649.1 DNA mismatch repair protein PMS2 [Nematocida major]